MASSVSSLRQFAKDSSYVFWCGIHGGQGIRQRFRETRILKAHYSTPMENSFVWLLPSGTRTALSASMMAWKIEMGIEAEIDALISWVAFGGIVFG